MTRNQNSRVHLRLSGDTLRALDEATAISGATYRSFFVANAIPDHLEDFEINKIPKKLGRGIYLRIPLEKKRMIEQIAATYDLTEQAILRHCINKILEQLQEQETGEEGTSR